MGYGALKGAALRLPLVARQGRQTRAAARPARRVCLSSRAVKRRPARNGNVDLSSKQVESCRGAGAAHPPSATHPLASGANPSAPQNPPTLAKSPLWGEGPALPSRGLLSSRSSLQMPLQSVRLVRVPARCIAGQKQGMRA